jgi:hypothetical protein
MSRRELKNVRSVPENIIMRHFCRSAIIEPENIHLLKAKLDEMTKVLGFKIFVAYICVLFPNTHSLLVANWRSIVANGRDSGTHKK